ncbi:hypothetical protein HJA82_28900 [Rhizobium bangladeshense]|uniref:hypothetical protein n=1 Tax=Rhizobium bangladeshense TaxID=1138189 RepID=UPI001C83EEE6|nr:hypothetical protein [Rhizobium bangladeshense]MBX4911332.1 hypothetical protein [Rhizobium bangladeshense]
MKLHFPASGYITVNKAGPDEPVRFVTAPLEAQFALSAWIVGRIGQNYPVVDEAGTMLTYRLTEMWAVEGAVLAKGELVGVEHTELNVISTAEHEAKLSSAIDIAFEGGRQVGAQEATEAFLAEQRQRILAAVESAADEVVRDALYKDLVFVKTTAPFAYAAEEPLPEASFRPLGAKEKGEVFACDCGVCEAARKPAESKPFWKPRYGPVGNRLDDE